MADSPALVFHHHPLFGLGAAGRELSGSGLRPRVIDGPGGGLPPRDLAGVACIVSLGGPMSATESPEYPWMRREIELLQEAIEEGIPVLGLGLGAHLLAVAAGGRVKPLEWQGRPWMEAGWSPVQVFADRSRSGYWSGLPAIVEAFHFHHETIDPPPGAVVVASSSADPCQAFELAGGHLGIQFLIEADENAIRRLVDESAEFLLACGLHPNQVTMDTIRRVHALQLTASQVFARFFDGALQGM